MTDTQITEVESEIEKREVNLSNQKLDKWGAFDRLRAKLVSRKLMVWLTATVLVIYNKVDGDQWVAVSLAYIGIQGIADIAARWKHGG